MTANDSRSVRPRPRSSIGDTLPEYLPEDLPRGLAAYARTPTFSADTIPAGLRKSHRTKAGAWATIVVLEGQLRYRILEPEVREFELRADRMGVVQPRVPHEVEAIGHVSFFVEFHR